MTKAGGHSHGPEAFAYAYKVLQWCEAQGIKASVELFPDGSGSLVFKQDKITREQGEQLTKMLHSNRWSYWRFAIDSCCGWHE